jgi:biotin carboxylase
MANLLGLFMKKTLLCDANFCVLPLVDSILSKMHHLSVAGMIETDPAHKIANNSVLIDYSNIDLLQKKIVEEGYDYIVPGCNDRSYFSLSKIAEKLGYPGFDKFETTLIINYKDKFRSFAESKGYPIPRSVNDLSEISSLQFPILIKPIDSFSGKGIQKIFEKCDLTKEWEIAKKFSKEGGVIAEEFVDGKLYSHSAFIKDKKIVIDFFVNEYCTVYPYQVNSSNISDDLNFNIQSDLKEWVEKFSQDLDLVDGLIHTQFISNGTNFYLIEVTRRCPGDLYSKLIEMSTGINYAELYTLPFIGEKLPTKIERKFTKFISRHTVSTDQDSIFLSSSVDIDNCGVLNIQLKTSGQKMLAAPFDKSGIYFIEFKNAVEMQKNTENLKNYITIQKLTPQG